MSRTFFVTRRFHIGYSILGRLIKRRIADAHHAEGIFILAFAALFICMVLINYLGWALLHASTTGETAAQSEFLFWIGQGALTLLFFVSCMFGFKPALRVTFDKTTGLAISQGKTLIHLPLQNIRSVTQIPALRYHQHYHKYVATRAFFVKLTQSLVLLSTSNGPVILGLPPADQQELLTLLQPQSEKIVFSTLSPTV